MIWMNCFDMVGLAFRTGIWSVKMLI